MSWTKTEIFYKKVIIYDFFLLRISSCCNFLTALLSLKHYNSGLFEFNFIDAEILSLLHDSTKKTVVTDNNDLGLQSTESYGEGNGDVSAVEGEKIFQNADNLFGKSSVVKDVNDGENDQVYGYDRNFAQIQKIHDKEASKRTGLTYQDPRVQVQEETGSQRVQVSNGFQEPFLPSLNANGRVSSGQLLEWSLCFYGTGPEEENN